MKNWIWVLVLLAVLVIIFLVTSVDRGQEDDQANQLTDVREVEVVMGDAYFEPTLIRAEVGEGLRFNIDNQGNWTHDLVIDELEVNSGILSGEETASVEFVASEEGIFTFYCSVSGHREMGQIGHLVVGDFTEAQVEQMIIEQMASEGDEQIATP